MNYRHAFHAGNFADVVKHIILTRLVEYLKKKDAAFRVIDTAGLDEASPRSLIGRMQEQTEAAIATADAVLFLIDARAGLTPVDRAFANLVRRSGKPAIVIANKSEGKAGQAGALEAHELGLGEPLSISAEHGEGLADLYASLRAALPDATAVRADARRQAGWTEGNGASMEPGLFDDVGENASVAVESEDLLGQVPRAALRGVR